VGMNMNIYLSIPPNLGIEDMTMNPSIAVFLHLDVRTDMMNPTICTATDPDPDLETEDTNLVG